MPLFLAVVGHRFRLLQSFLSILRKWYVHTIIFIKSIAVLQDIARRIFSQCTLRRACGVQLRLMETGRDEKRRKAKNKNKKKNKATNARRDSRADNDTAVADSELNQKRKWKKKRGWKEGRGRATSQRGRRSADKKKKQKKPRYKRRPRSDSTYSGFSSSYSEITCSSSSGRYISRREGIS